MGGYISFKKISSLSQYKHTKDSFLTKRISHASEPLIWWTQSYLMTHQNENFIIVGTIEYLFPDEKNRAEEYRQGQAYFNKLQRWIYKNWLPRQKGGTAFGEDAQNLVQYQGYLARSLPPNIVEIEHIKL